MISLASMKGCPLLLLAAVVALGCSDKKKEAQVPAQPAAQAPAPPPAPPKPEEDPAAQQARLEALGKRRTELQQLIDAKKRELEEMKARHAKEEAGLPDPASFRPRLMQLIRDANLATSQYASMKKQADELKAVAESKVTGELKELRAQKAEVDKRYDDALSGWKKAIEEASLGVVQESPVKRELDLLRQAKKRWFELTPAARSGAADGAERKSVSDSFRGWLREQKERESVVAKVLAQPEAGAGKDPGTYDFTDLDFYILLELFEDVLDKQNVAIENKQYAEEEKKLAVIEEESEKLRLEIGRKIAEGGPDLTKYEDLVARLDDQQKKAGELQRLATEFRKVLAELETTRERHQQEQEALSTELEAARKELLALGK